MCYAVGSVCITLGRTPCLQGSCVLYYVRRLAKWLPKVVCHLGHLLCLLRKREWEKRDELGSGSNCVRAPIVWACGVSGCFKDMTTPLLAVIFCPSLLGGAIRKCWSAQCSAKTNFSAVADCSLTTGLGWKYWWIFSVLLHFLVATEQLLTCLVQLVILKTVS